MRRHKYKAVRTEVDGIKFASKKEAARYVNLKLLERAKIIENLRLQVRFELNEGGTFKYGYIADFVYFEGGKQVVEDAKGFLTPEFKKKQKLMKKVHGIEIKLT